ASHQQGVAKAAADARARAAETDGQTTSLEAEVTNAVAGQRAAATELNTAAARQKEVIGQLEKTLHHRIQLAIADRRAAQEAARQAAREAARQAAAEAARKAQEQQQPGPTGPSGPTTSGPGGPSGPLPGPSEPIPTTGEIVDLITSFWGTGYDGQVAKCVGWRESRYQPTARNTSSGAAGIFQLMPFWWDGNNEFGWKFDPYDARQNIVHAHMIWQAYGWGPWTTGHLCV
ncbi:MAG TPA: lytic transglycosylase domain-containing protein, partial [Actinomycetota bacterium]|nr:lytic transglycosylase domain-containing protein [Actinomycetota bacterium]